MTTKMRRKFIRGLTDIPVEFSVQGQFYDGLIKNISKDGVFIETNETFSVGQGISLHFGKENMIGKIVWVIPYGFGVKFGKS